MNYIFKLKQIPISLDLVKRVSILLSVTTLIMLILNINRFVDLRGGGIGNPNMRVIKEYFADGSLRREIPILNGKREGGSPVGVINQEWDLIKKVVIRPLN